MKSAGKIFVRLLEGILLLVFPLIGQAAAQTWSLTGSMSTAREGHTQTLLADGRVLVTGGNDHTGPVFASAEVYDPAQGTWASTGTMTASRYAHTATLLLDGRVLVSGGVDASDSALASAEIYDPASGIWSLTGSMSTGRVFHAASLLLDGRVLVSGGYGSWTSAEIYDPAQGTWSLTGAMGTPRYGQTATLLSDGRVLMTGGGGDAEIYDPAQGLWSWTAAMNKGRIEHTATLLADGRVLVTGGTDQNGIGMASAEIYDPTQDTWSLTAPMSIGRDLHTATLLEGGHVLVSGGVDPTGAFSASAEIYDPLLAAWSPVGAMNTGRSRHTASLLLDGQVLVSAGGTGRSSTSNGVLASAEIFASDGTPPQVSCGASDGAWHDSDVIIACAASDPESGLANAADASFGLTTNVPSGTETANAPTNSRQVCNTAGECVTVGPINGNMVDKQPATITVASPAANATYQLYASVSASYACADGGSGVASCQGPIGNASPIDTSSIGTKTFTVTSIDTVNNPSTLTVTYSVVSGGGGGQTSADVGIALSAPAKVSTGGTLTYSMTVTNVGKVTATGVVVSDALPAGTVFASVSSSQGTATTPAVGRNGTVTVNLGNLAKDATATISVVVTVTAASGALLANTAMVTATTQDLNSSNNSATQNTTVSKK